MVPLRLSRRCLCRRENVVVRKLQIVEAGIGSAARHELRVRAALADLAVFEHENFVRAANRGQRCAITKVVRPTIRLARAFCTYISDSASSSDVASSRMRMGESFKYGTRDGNSLPLAAAQTRAALADDGVVLQAAVP